MGVRDLNDFCHLASQVTDWVYAVGVEHASRATGLAAARHVGRRA